MEFLISDSRPQIVRELSQSLCLYMGTKLLTTIDYHPQGNSDIGDFKKTIATRLPHYVNEHQNDCNAPVQSITYAHISQVHLSTRTKLFSLTLTRELPAPADRSPAIVVLQIASRTITARIQNDSLLARVCPTCGRADLSIKTPLVWYKKYFDKRTCCFWCPTGWCTQSRRTWHEIFK